MSMDFGNWAFRNKKLIYFLLVVLIGGGLYSCYKMSKLEDPEIRVKQAMVIVTYPGATAQEIEMQIADPLEKSIMTIKTVDEVTTSCMADMCIMTVALETTVPDNELEQNWDILRRKVQAAAVSFPEGAGTPIIKDDFDTLFGLFYALTGDGMDYRELSDWADLIKRDLMGVDGVTRVDIYGMPQECIDISLNQSRMSNLGVLPLEVLSTLKGQNSTVYAGYYNADNQRIKINVEDKFRQIDDIGNIIIQGHEDEQLRLSDIAEITSGYNTPVRNKMLYNGEISLGICIGTKAGMDVLKIGAAVQERLDNLSRTRFPAGLEMHQIFFQPDCVEQSLSTFAINLAESILIVILVLMIFMGFKSALIIGISLLETVLGSFVVLYGMDGTMQRVSLGAFILAMGILVDNAIVIVDGILVDLNTGDGSAEQRRKAMTSIGKRTAMPLLGATLIALLAFFPIYLSPDTSGVYVRDLFIVLAVSLLLSWILALVHVPLMANRYLKKTKKKSAKESAPYRWLGGILRFSLRHRFIVMAIMLAMLGVSLYFYKDVKQGFFPDMEYEQLYIEYKLPEGTNAERTEADLTRMAALLKEKFPKITNITTSVGATPCRYNLVRTVSPPSLSYGELIVDFKSAGSLEAAVDDMQSLLTEEFPDAYVKVKRYNIMYKKYPIEVQFCGPDPAVLHSLSDTVMRLMERNPKVQCITTDWEPKVPMLSIDYNQSQARRSGLSRRNIAMSMLSANEGIPVSTWYDGTHPMTLNVHTVDDEGNAVDNLDNVGIFGDLPSLSGLLNRETLIKLQSGHLSKDDLVASLTTTTPLLQLGEGVSVQWDDPVVLRYNGARSQRVQCSPAAGVTTEAARLSVEKDLASLTLPDGYTMQWQGEKYASNKTMRYLFGAVPLAIILIIGILIWLFRGYKKPLIILLSIPFIFIGIIPTMILSGNAFTFVAIVGALGLTGMMIKNGIVLMDEITLRVDERTEGQSQQSILIAASKSRLRPVMMASLTTILGMVPLLTDAMFGSLAACVMGGLAVGSLTILVVLPVLYSFFYKQPKTPKNESTK